MHHAAPSGAALCTGCSAPAYGPCGAAARPCVAAARPCVAAARPRGVVAHPCGASARPRAAAHAAMGSPTMHAPSARTAGDCAGNLHVSLRSARVQPARSACSRVSVSYSCAPSLPPPSTPRRVHPSRVAAVVGQSEALQTPAFDRLVSWVEVHSGEQPTKLVPLA
eukprot:216645-Chlamydomonas_euryale.AAC.2